MDHDHMAGMDGMTPSTNGMDHHDSMAMSHMTFFWGKNSEILFSGWPGRRSGMYALALVFVFFLALIVEWLSCCGRKKWGGGVVGTVVHGLRIGLGYVVMLAVMSFNVGVLIVAIAGHTLGFFLFGSRVFKILSGGDDSDKGFPHHHPAC